MTRPTKSHTIVNIISKFRVLLPRFRMVHYRHIFPSQIFLTVSASKVITYKTLITPNIVGMTPPPLSYMRKTFNSFSFALLNAIRFIGTFCATELSFIGIIRESPKRLSTSDAIFEIPSFLHAIIVHRQQCEVK